MSNMLQTKTAEEILSTVFKPKEFIIDGLYLGGEFLPGVIIGGAAPLLLEDGEFADQRIVGGGFILDKFVVRIERHIGCGGRIHHLIEGGCGPVHRVLESRLVLLEGGELLLVGS